jgi:hypothetical protein
LPRRTKDTRRSPGQLVAPCGGQSVRAIRTPAPRHCGLSPSHAPEHNASRDHGGARSCDIPPSRGALAQAFLASPSWRTARHVLPTPLRRRSAPRSLSCSRSRPRSDSQSRSIFYSLPQRCYARHGVDRPASRHAGAALPASTFSLVQHGSAAMLKPMIDIPLASLRCPPEALPGRPETADTVAAA